MMTPHAFPGFVDLQVNGYLGVNFSDPTATAEDFACAARALLQQGTVAFLPTVITSPLDTYARNLPRLADLIESEEFRGRLLGLHLEGPFISPREGAVGAHRPEWTRLPDLQTFERMQQWARGHVRLLTLAPELPGADRLARFCVRHGVTVSLGHHLGSAEEIRRLVRAGARAATHLGNGLPHLIDRHRNPLWPTLANEELTAMIIPDGHHLPPDLVRVVVRAKGAARLIVTSDASPLAGMRPGRYTVAGQEVRLERSGRLSVTATGYLAGSSATMLFCMNWLAALEVLSPRDLVRVGFSNPLRLIGYPARLLRLGPGRWRYDEATCRFLPGTSARAV